jgi:predicted NBD/HSP70 family sugar kinase
MVGTGIGIAGRVDADQATVHSHTDRLGWEFKVANNVHAITLAESTYGAATAMDDFALICVSTVTGAGLMMGGQRYWGQRSAL